MVDTNKRFVYGSFFWPGRATKRPPSRPTWVGQTLDAWDQVAIEIIREYGANELIGKMYWKGALNQWLPIQPKLVSDIEWFKIFHKLPEPLRVGTKVYYFEMEGSGRWSVLHFRTESDEMGPYVAVALRYGPVQTQTQARIDH